MTYVLRELKKLLLAQGQAMVAAGHPLITGVITDLSSLTI
jgi:hypothetical protein